ncbi:CfrBI family restriction endonuclease [Flexilinea flocculi]|uniref:CfrBI restriction endonuclease n=1 Tax=Flexilinea flocculi TaxID=1678840 RepID=A0A0S7BS10_9CHLR|nr:CfrBI family restriction endonuclease [Flexilinea flocculi]GAP40177.1 cfrBI restriction endonuclease [Flexilinea flocculi]
MIIDDLFPEKGKLVLTANGKEFIERLGVETARQVILAVLRGENIRTQTEPLTRRRVAIATGAMVYLFAKGWAEIDNFTENLSAFALEQMDNTPQSKKDTFWPAQWLIGLTGKSIQNVLRSNPELRQSYIQDFENAVEEAARRCEEDFGEISMSLGYVVDGELRQSVSALNWKDLTRLTTAIGATTLTIRGSEKSTYGKLFERLIMGSVLTILGFEHVENSQSPKIERVFWLSDSSDVRECDATIRLRPGKLARFDIGFIGKGNPEIMKDKLTRYANEVEQNGTANFSQTFIIVDKMPDTTKTIEAAKKSGSEIIQMSMQFWALELAKRLKARLGYSAEILSVPEDELSDYIEQKLQPVPILNFLNPTNTRIQVIREEAQPYLISEDEEDFEDE